MGSRLAGKDAIISGGARGMGEPEEVANTALYFASDESSFVNGTHLFVDNGFTAM
jgi:NAD(P)-dependent dehydrogenase (short-subunit alcohol dehydrogenase family)